MASADDIHLESIEEAKVVIATLTSRVDEFQRILHIHEEEHDTFLRTPFLKRIVFWFDGWPLHEVVDAPAWRPWRRWWTS